MSWYDPPNSVYDVTWQHVIDRHTEWGNLHGLSGNLPGNPYCAMTDLPMGALVEIEWHGIKTRCYVADYGPEKAVFPNRVVDASVEVFEHFAARDAGVLSNVTVRLIDATYCGPAPRVVTPATVARSTPDPALERLRLLDSREEGAVVARRPVHRVAAPAPPAYWPGPGMGRCLCWPI